MIDRPILRFIAVVCLLSTLAARADEVPQAQWETSFEQDIEWLRLAANGRLIVGTRATVFGIDYDNGQVVWRMDDLQNTLDGSFGRIPQSRLAIVVYGAPRTTTVIDYVDGRQLWDSRALGFLSTMGEFHLPSVGALMVYGQGPGGKDRMVAASMWTGAVLWENNEFFSECQPEILKTSSHQQTLTGNQYPLFDSDTTMITFMNKVAIRKWDVRSGDLMWKTELHAKKTPTLLRRFAPMRLSRNHDVVYVPFDNTIVAIRTRDGALVWNERPKLRSNVYQIQVLPQGILVKGAGVIKIGLWGPNSKVRGNPFLTLLDTATGLPIWEKEFRKLKDGEYTNFLIHRDSVFVFSKKKLYAVAIADGGYREFAKGLKFEGNDQPCALISRNGNYLLISGQNLIMVNDRGEKVFQKYYKAPGVGFLGKLFTFMGVVAFNSISGLTIGERFGYYPIIAGYSFPHYGNSTCGQNYMYMLTLVNPDEYRDQQAARSPYKKKSSADDGESVPAGYGLVKLSLDTGNEVAAVVLGAKRPVYAIEQSESMVLYVKGKDKLVCSHFHIHSTEDTVRSAGQLHIHSRSTADTVRSAGQYTWAGISLMTYSEDLADSLVPEIATMAAKRGGLYVTEVSPGSAGDKAGVVPGSIIIRMCGIDVSTVSEFEEALKTAEQSSRDYYLLLFMPDGALQPMDIKR